MPCPPHLVPWPLPPACCPTALPRLPLQNFDTLTRSPYLINMAYHERTSAVAYAHHFGVQLSGKQREPGSEGGRCVCVTSG